MVAKLSLASKAFPSWSLGTRSKGDPPGRPYGYTLAPAHFFNSL